MREDPRPRRHRIRAMLEMIRRGPASGRLVNCSDFCREFSVCRRTAMNDLDALRDDEGAPISYDTSRRGYFLADDTWTLPAVTLSRKQVFAFSMARKVLAAYRGTPFEAELESALDRVGESLEGTVLLDPQSLTDHFLILGEDHVRIDPDTWSAVAGCVERQERMHIDYQRFDGATGDYDLEPLHLVAYHGNWYVLARKKGEEDVRTFAVSRIHRLTGTRHQFEVPPDFDARAHFAKAFGITTAETAFKVRLLFSAKIAAYIEERVWHPTQEMRRRRDGSLELKMETGGWKELVRWVLSWQPDVQVLSPKRLRERVEEKMRQALRHRAGRAKYAVSTAMERSAQDPGAA